ncbi:MAG: 8-oxo-dGTP diphosphatase MutT [bacterium]
MKNLDYIPILDAKTVQVVACVIERGGEFLITKRLKTSHLGHCWEFPGGKLEPGENLAQCAIRECQEEIDVVVNPLRLLQEVSHAYPEKSVHLYFVLCTLESGTPRAIECADWRWVHPRQLSEYEFPEADKQIIADFIRAAG